MPASLESSRPIMAPSLASKRTSNRYSTYSMAASTLAPSVAPSFSQDIVQQEITEITEGLEKLENKKLSMQRFVPSKEKSENLSKLALGAKLERALDRRMFGQDAVMRKKKVVVGPLGEKGDVMNEKVMA